MPHTATGQPYAAGSETSREAALRASAFVSEQGVRVYRWICEQGLRGGTQKEAEAALGIARPSLCARFKGLEDAEAIRKTRQKRAGCVAYVSCGAPPVQLGLLGGQA